MNQRQEDEILALSSIYPNAISTFPYNSSSSLLIKLDSLDLGDPRDFIITDFSTPIPPSPAAVLLPSSVVPSLTPNQPQGPRRHRNRRGRPATQPSPQAQPAPNPPPSTPVVAAPRASLVITLQSLKGSTTTAPEVVLLRPAPVAPPEPTVEINEVEEKAKKLRLKYLPSIFLEVDLGVGYPELTPPTVKINEITGWLCPEGKRKLAEELKGVWNGEECLWLLVEIITTPEVLGPLLGWANSPISLLQQNTSPTPLSETLATHNRLFSSTVFSSSNFTCGICLEQRKGKKCVKLTKCGDVFCLTCLVSYFTLLITEGLVESVHCPDLACVKNRSQQAKNGFTGKERVGDVTKQELVEIVGEDLVKRWERLAEKKLIESDPSICHCPREACQAPVSRGLDDGEKLRVCSRCSYSFCVFCRQTWHGTQTPCALPQSSLIVSKYLSGDESEQTALERRYGKSNIRRLVAVFEEDRLNREWVEENSMPCPGCKISVERSEGCAHMQCARCQCHFCFRCGVKLSALNPYEHFSALGSSCYNKLFDFQPGNEPAPAEWLHLIDDDH